MSTVLTFVHIGQEGGDLPITGLGWHEAHALASSLDARLPTAAEWERMAAGPDGRRYPWGEEEWTPQHANLRASGYGCVLPVGQYPLGATPDGLLDVAGNVWEWTADRLPGDGAIVLGGSYNSVPRYAECGYRNDVPAGLASPGIGLRLVRDR